MTASIILNIFSADTWGTVSDWVMIGIAALTAILLLKTLKSQKDVQRTQNEFFKIESTRFRESIKPKLKYSGSTDKLKPSGSTQKILTIELTNETDSAALKISRMVSDGRNKNQVFVPMGFIDHKDHLTKGDAPLFYHFLIDTKAPHTEWIVFTINYQDIAGTKYRQRVVCISDKFGTEINPSLPEIIIADTDETEKFDIDNKE